MIEIETTEDMATIIVDGSTYSGKNVQIINGRVIVDGKETNGKEYGSINVIVNGNLETLDCTSAEINGDVHGNVDATNVTCKAIGGDVDATNVKCDFIEGDVDAVNVTTRK